MSGSDHHPRAGRLAALATLVVSAALFLTALVGIATIDPNAGAAAPAGGPSIHDVSLPRAGDDSGQRRDCPFHQHDRPRNGDGAGNGVSS